MSIDDRKLEEMMVSTWIALPICCICDIDEEEKMIRDFINDEFNFQGVYEIRMELFDGHVYECECVFVEKDIIVEGGITEYVLYLQPIYCPDEKMLEYRTIMFDYEWIKSNLKNMHVDFFQWSEEDQKTLTINDLSTFDGYIVENDPDINSIEYKGTMYQVLDNIIDENGYSVLLTFNKNDVPSKEWELAEQDGFMGIIKKTFILYTGETFEEEITIDEIDGDIVHCNEYNIPPINSGNTPRVIPKDKYDELKVDCSKEGVRLCYVPLDFKYIPYNSAQEI